MEVEWGDNVRGFLDNISAHISRADRSLVKLHAVAQAVSSIQTEIRGGDLTFAASVRAPQVDPFELPKRLNEICDRSLRTLIRLSPDAETLRAPELRSIKGLKPAAIGKREHADCLIIETCLAHCKALRSHGLPERCVFVPSNKADFCGEGPPLRPREDLAAECSALDLHFALAFDHALSIIHP